MLASAHWISGDRDPASEDRISEDRISEEEARGSAAADGQAEDRAAVLAVRAGDREAFGRLVKTYQRRLFGLVLMMVRDPAGAEEVTQDAFVRAFTRLEYYDVRRPFYPWIATIAARLAQNWLRRPVREIELDEAPDAEPAAEAADSDPLIALIALEDRRRLWRSVAALSSGERTAVYLFYRQEMSVKEIAGILGVSGGTVKTLLFRARKKLRETPQGQNTDQQTQEVRS